jgi:hypothetical protein
MPSYVQSVRVPKRVFASKTAAMQWVLSHGYRVVKQPHETAAFWQFRQREPQTLSWGRFRTTTLPNGVELVVYYY